ncbi:MAG: outer membrane lipid asymmetry maintenance protein MlaD [Azoarcus sp.]|jgi:phospholipid/cholesterol/gamma-HCH transport system substrate-binding protein|nr:outer membrane lipid asymmetry maintenance protein MlaD [Azoarcus sp.]
MSRTTLDLWVGLFVALGFAALVFLATKAGSYSGLASGRAYTVEASFDNIGGLKAKAPVKSAGVLVGRVADIRFDVQSYRAVVKLDLDPRYQFPRDTIATILTAGLLGEQYVGLEPGGDSDVLKNGDRITMTQSAVVLEKLIGQFMFNKAAESPSQP